VQLTPRYEGEPLIRMRSVIDDPAVPVLRQRRRLADLLAGLDDGQWATASRCEGWTVQDVVAHLITTNQFWTLSINAGLAGAPTRVLVRFDPVATPAQLVATVRSRTPAETLDLFCSSNDELAAVLVALDTEAWSRPAEAPPGHLSIDLVALHALWDGWIHERDIALPLGLTTDEEADEIAASLAYVAALGPAFTASQGSTRAGVLEVRAVDPDVRVVVELGPSVLLHDGPAPPGAVTLSGDAVHLLEALSMRAPLQADIDDADRWLLGGLDEVFDQSPRG